MNATATPFRVPSAGPIASRPSTSARALHQWRVASPGRAATVAPLTSGWKLSALALDGNLRASPYIFKEALFRGNIVVAAGGESVETPYHVSAVEINSVRRGLLEGNVINLPSSEPEASQLLRQAAVGAVRYSNNQAPDGQVIRSTDWGTGKKQGDLSTGVEDSLTMALL